MLTTTEQLTLNILNAKNPNDVHTIGLDITKGFINKEITFTQAACLRNAITEVLKEFGYIKCGGTGR